MPQREEESLLEEMREAIRGDRERAAARAGSPPVPPAPPAPERAPEPAPEPAEPAKPFLRRLLGR